MDNNVLPLDLRCSLRSQENALALYLPAEDEVTYDLGRVSQRLLYVREQVIYMTRLRVSDSLGVWESTLRCYEEGEFEPRYCFFVHLYHNDLYWPYIHFILTGIRGADYLSAPVHLPPIKQFGNRLRYLREQIFQLSRPALSERLNGFSPYNFKNYETGYRQPAIQFLQLCTQHELMHPYFLWLFFGHPSDEGLVQEHFDLPIVTNIENRQQFKAAQDWLRNPK